MSVVTVDDAVSNLLRDRKEPVTVLDTRGAVLGQFIPGVGERPYEPPPLSEAEWQRRLSEPSHSTSEVLERMRSLDVRR